MSGQSQKSLMGIRVLYCGHNGVFVADAYRVAGAVAVRANGPVTMDKLDRRESACKAATHHLSDFPVAGLWRPDIGVFVVPENQLREVGS